MVITHTEDGEGRRSEEEKGQDRDDQKDAVPLSSRQISTPRRSRTDMVLTWRPQPTDGGHSLRRAPCSTRVKSDPL